MMKKGVLTSEAGLPFTVEAEAGGSGPDSLASWYLDNKDLVEDKLLERGAVLFRGFGVDRQEIFERVTQAFPGRKMDYVDGNSPRKKLASGVYTSTEYPAEYFISMHNELSYAEIWPTRLFFCCVTPPLEGGETPLADSRAILKSLSPEIVDVFIRKKVKYVRNLHGGRGFGPSWQSTFETRDRAVVEEHCRATGAGFRWNQDGSLTLSHVRQAVVTHPKTGETVWFNQADQFHPSTHPKQVYESMMLLYKGREDRLPQNACFGDGTPLDVAMLEEVRETVKGRIRSFAWLAGDLLMVDNVLVCHGRMPFKGPRKILVSMTQD